MTIPNLCGATSSRRKSSASSKPSRAAISAARSGWDGSTTFIAPSKNARTITDFGEKQGFLNTVYERFFQGWSTRQADTMGIVYTPQPIVDWMCQSCDEVLKPSLACRCRRAT
jgi:hypothetical protein